MHSSGVWEEGNPFSGWVTVQAGMQRLRGQKEGKRQRAQPGPSGQGSPLGEAGPRIISLISILPMENKGTSLILFLVNTYTKNHLLHSSAIERFLG